MKFSKIFSSNMVFAAKKPIRVYGEGKGTAEITFAGFKKTVISVSENWEIEFEPMEHGGPYTLEALFGDDIIIFDNIYVGEVFLFAGQSNMEFKMRDSKTPQELYCSNDMLRLYSTDTIKNSDRFTTDDGWVICNKKDVGDWSALAYLVSNEISEKNNIAIGAISCYQGASVIESWVPEGTYSKLNIDIPKKEKHMDHDYEWNKDGMLYSYSLSQVKPFSVSAVIWYQGESDATKGEGMVYREMLATMIDIWRKDFRDENLPFIIVQIADTEERLGDGWSLIQKAQEDIAKERDFVKTVISKDICETDDIHPPTKDKLAKRIISALSVKNI